MACPRSAIAALASFSLWLPTALSAEPPLSQLSLLREHMCARNLAPATTMADSPSVSILAGVLNRAVSPELVQTLSPAWERARAAWAAHQSDSGSAGWRARRASLEFSRMAGSRTIMDREWDPAANRGTITASHRFVAATGKVDEFIADGRAFDVGSIALLNRILNGPEKGSGDLRKPGQNLIGGEATQIYVLGREVRFAMESLVTGAQYRLHAGVHPVVVASWVFQWIIAIHPFHQGNGRTARLVADWILMSYGYPPLVMGIEEMRVAVFPFPVGFGVTHVTLEDVLQRVTAGLQRSGAHLTAGRP